MVALEKIMHMGEEIEVGGGGFKNVSNPVYIDGLLHSFTGDGKEYTLTYSNRILKTVSVGDKTYNIDYDNGLNLVSISENS